MLLIKLLQLSLIPKSRQLLQVKQVLNKTSLQPLNREKHARFQKSLLQDNLLLVSTFFKLFS